MSTGSSWIERGARPWNLVVRTAGKEDLEQLQAAGLKRNHRPNQIEAPGSHKLLAELPLHHIGVTFESIQPIVQGLSIVETQVFDVQDGKAEWLKDTHHLAQSGRMRARKNTPLDPRINGQRKVLPDRVNQPDAILSQATMNDLAQMTVVLDAHMFQHSDGDEGVTPASDATPIVLYKLDTVFEAHVTR